MATIIFQKNGLRALPDSPIFHNSKITNSGMKISSKKSSSIFPFQNRQVVAETILANYQYLRAAGWGKLSAESPNGESFDSKKLERNK